MIPRLSAFPHPDRKPKEVELTIEGIDYTCLCLVQGKFQPRQYLPQFRHRSLGSASAQDNNIIRIADYARTEFLLQSVPFPYPVQKVQVEVGQ